MKMLVASAIEVVTKLLTGLTLMETRSSEQVFLTRRQRVMDDPNKQATRQTKAAGTFYRTY